MTRLPAPKRREQLLDCAAQLFAQHGYARSTTAELARAAGVTEPIIYRHFKSKRDLFIALIERAGRETLALWEEDLGGASDPAERLRRLLGDNPMVAERGRNEYRVVLQAITEVEDEEIHAALNAHIRQLHEFISREVAAAQTSHVVTGRFSSDLIAWLLIDIGLGYGALSAMGVEGHGFDDRGMHVKELLARVLVGQARAGGGSEGGSEPDSGESDGGKRPGARKARKKPAE